MRPFHSESKNSMSSVSEEKKTRQRLAARWRDVKREVQHLRSANTAELRARYAGHLATAVDAYRRHVETLRGFADRWVDGGYVQPTVQARHADERLKKLLAEHGLAEV